MHKEPTKHHHKKEEEALKNEKKPEKTMKESEKKTPEENKKEIKKAEEKIRKPKKSFGEELLKTFSLKKDQEKLKEIMEDVRDGVPFYGTNLWVLILAILIASVGLNMNSPAVIIGAMLISPLMGPIIGMGVSLAIHDIPLLKKAMYNYSFAVVISLITSLLYFAISPISIAHSEILARTTPTIYDVFIALFGGLAGSIALASTKKGNVVPGVAIATALMPPLCTAGYGLATLNFTYFAGAFYLFIINTVFITTSAFIVARILQFPYKKSINEKEQKSSKRIITAIVILTIIPSVYLGFDIIKQTRFSEQAKKFIQYETTIEGDYLLKQNIDAKNQKIQLIYGGKPIDESKINELKSKLGAYGLESASFEIKQGFASLYAEENNNAGAGDEQSKKQIEELTAALEKSESRADAAEQSLQKNILLSKEIKNEILTLSPHIVDFSLLQSTSLSGSQQISKNFGYIISSKSLDSQAQDRLTSWLEARSKEPHLKVFFEVQAPEKEDAQKSEASTRETPESGSGEVVQ